MKNLIITIVSLLFSTLFYKQNMGLNMLLFAIISVIFLMIFNLEKFKEKATILKSIIYIFTSLFVFIQPNNLTIFTSIVSFILLVGTVSEAKSAIYVTLLNGMYSSIVAVFSHYFDKVSTEIEQVKKQKTNYGFWLKIIGIPLLVLTIFIGLYRNANPVFDELIGKIDVSFINFQWLIFTAMAFYLFSNISKPITIEPVTSTDLKTPNYLIKDNLKTVSNEKLKTENQLGIILTILLNILITVVLITDYLYLNSDINMDNVGQFSERVHQGIYALIASIIFAIGIIIYFFRGNLNFYKHNQVLKSATYIWIFLNILLVFTTVLKNQMYVVNFGFTYKRIGVYVYLLLVFIGLIFTFIKVHRIKNITYLFRKNLQVTFGVLVIASVINWDTIITNFNLNKVRNSRIDVPYLLNLQDNITILKSYKSNHTEKYNAIHLNNYPEKIDQKYTDYIESLGNNSWQEMVYDNFNN